MEFDICTSKHLLNKKMTMNTKDENLVRLLNVSLLTPNVYSVKIHHHISDFDTYIPYIGT